MQPGGVEGCYWAVGGFPSLYFLGRDPYLVNSLLQVIMERIKSTVWHVL